MLMSFLVWLHTVAYGALLFAPPVEPEQLVGLARARVEATLAEEPITSTLAGGTEDTHITSYYINAKIAVVFRHEIAIKTWRLK